MLQSMVSQRVVHDCVTEQCNGDLSPSLLVFVVFIVLWAYCFLFFPLQLILWKVNWAEDIHSSPISVSWTMVFKALVSSFVFLFDKIIGGKNTVTHFLKI